MTIDDFLKQNPTRAIVLRSDQHGKILACVCREDQPNVIFATAISSSAKTAAECATRRFCTDYQVGDQLGVQT